MTLEMTSGTTIDSGVDQLPTPEKERPKIGVIAIDGFRWSGVSTVSKDLATLISQRTGHRPKLFSVDEEYFRIQEEAKSMIGVNTEADIHREVDRRMAAEMINPANNGRLLIIEGSRMPFVAKELERQAREGLLPLRQGVSANISPTGEGAPFPAQIVTAFIYAEAERRYDRKYHGEPNEWRNHAMTLLELERTEEQGLQTFWQTYPNLTGENPANIGFSVAGKPVYDLFYDSSEHASMDIALKIFESNRVQNNILPVIAQTSTS